MVMAVILRCHAKHIAFRSIVKQQWVHRVFSDDLGIRDTSGTIAMLKIFLPEWAVLPKVAAMDFETDHKRRNE